MREGRVEANGLRFAYLAEGPGSGPLALCLHGFPDHAPTFEGLLAALGAAGFFAVAPWMRGYAPTDVPSDGRYQTAALALDALALADALAPGRPAVVVGHDWGAAAAYLAACHAPRRFGRLVGMAVPPPAALAARLLRSPAQLRRWWYVWFFLTPWAEAAVAADDFALVDFLWRQWSPGFEPPASYRRTLKATLASPGTLGAALGYYRATFGSGPQDPELAEVQAKASDPVPVPSLYLHGADDGCLGAELIDPEAVASCFAAGVRVEVVAAAGHFLHLERPEAVCRRVVEFLAAQP